MFNNLIESSSHTREFKRRGSFVLFTAATYMLLFVVGGVASIYAYDARLDYQNNEMITMLSPLDYPAAPAPAVRNTPPPKGSDKPTVAVRQIAIASVNRPDIVPPVTSVKPNTIPPVPDHGDWILGPNNSDPIQPSGLGRAGNSGNGNGTPGVSSTIDVGTPPPAPTPEVQKPAPRTISKGAITGLALVLPKPPYPPLGRQARAQGAVNVQVLIDESGKVVSAKAVSGHPLLMAAAVQAAYGARFSPTRLGEQAVKVSGVITYKFELQ